MKKRVLLLAVSCKNGGLCPGGLDLDDPREWIRIVRDDGMAGAVQGIDIDFARPLDVIEFEGKPKPQGKQRENWIILNSSCVNCGRGELDGDSSTKALVDWAYERYKYNGFWGNYRSYLDENEFNDLTGPSESIMRVSDVVIYTDDNDKPKIDFNWSGSKYRCKYISMTDQDFYDKIDDGDTVAFDNAYIVTSIPKELWQNPYNGKWQAFKFVSRVYGFNHSTEEDVIDFSSMFNDIKFPG